MAAQHDDASAGGMSYENLQALALLREARRRRRRRWLRLAPPSAGSSVVTLDANDRQDDDGRRLGTHPDHPAVARTAPQLGKFNHSPHSQSPNRALLARPVLRFSN